MLNAQEILSLLLLYSVLLRLIRQQATAIRDNLSSGWLVICKRITN